MEKVYAGLESLARLLHTRQLDVEGTGAGEQPRPKQGCRLRWRDRLQRPNGGFESVCTFLIQTPNHIELEDPIGRRLQGRKIPFLDGGGPREPQILELQTELTHSLRLPQPG